MNSRKRKRAELRNLCAELHPDDGIDPRDDKRADAIEMTRPDRKLRQLCKQVAQTLLLAMADLPEAEMLAGVTVRDVVPAPHAGRLAVMVLVPDSARRADVARVVRRNTGRLRHDVALAITRRRAPELVFEFVVEGGGDG